jgi:hypothetical protein
VEWLFTSAMPSIIAALARRLDIVAPQGRSSGFESLLQSSARFCVWLLTFPLSSIVWLMDDRPHEIGKRMTVGQLFADSV